MQKKSKIALVIISVLCGLSASYFGYEFANTLYDVPRGFTPLITKAQFVWKILAPFIYVSLALTTPTLIPDRFTKTYKVFRIIIAFLAFIGSFFCSFIAVPESARLWYSMNKLEVAPSFLSALTLTLGTFTAAIILLWPEISGRLLTKGSSGSLRVR